MTSSYERLASKSTDPLSLSLIYIYIYIVFVTSFPCERAEHLSEFERRAFGVFFLNLDQFRTGGIIFIKKQTYT